MMGSLFGHRWASSFGREIDPDRVWEATLHGITEQQVREGLRRCADLCMEWPPTAPEFRRLCIEGTDTWEHAQIAAADREAYARALPAPVDFDRNREELSKIRAMLK